MEKQNTCLRTAAIVVTYNRLGLLKRCVECLRSQTAPCDILIIDNNSDDGTAAWVKTRPELVYLNTGGNLGGAGGFNRGIKLAVEMGYELLWLMDDDTLPQPTALEELLAADSVLGGEYGYLSSVALWTDGTECKMNRQKLKKSFYEYSHLLRYGLVQAEQATFVSLLVRRGTVEKAGLPISEFFIWGDDIEYTRRIAVRLGLPGFVCGRSIVEHAMKDNNGSSLALDGHERIARYNYAFRNENYLYRREGLKGFCYYFAKCGINGLRVLKHAPDRKAARLWIIIKQFFCGLFFNPQVEYVKLNGTDCTENTQPQSGGR